MAHEEAKMEAERKTLRWKGLNEAMEAMKAVKLEAVTLRARLNEEVKEMEKTMPKTNTKGKAKAKAVVAVAKAVVPKPETKKAKAEREKAEAKAEADKNEDKAKRMCVWNALTDSQKADMTEEKFEKLYEEKQKEWNKATNMKTKKKEDGKKADEDARKRLRKNAENAAKEMADMFAKKEEEEEVEGSDAWKSKAVKYLEMVKVEQEGVRHSGDTSCEEDDEEDINPY